MADSRRPSLRAALYSLAGLGEDNFRHQQDGADHDGTIGYIKRRPVIAPQVEVEEVNDVAGRHAVPQIAGGAAKNQRQANGGGAESMAVLPQQCGDDDERDHREAYQRADLPLRRRFGEQAESCASVLHMRQMEEAGDDGNAVVQWNIAGDHPFRQAIEQQHDGCNEEEVFAHGLSCLRVAVHALLLDAAIPGKEHRKDLCRRYAAPFFFSTQPLQSRRCAACSYRALAVASISESTALQRSQTVGYALSSPTCVE